MKECLYTERLNMRKWTDSDAESLYEYAKDPEVGPIAGWPMHDNLEFSRMAIREYLSAPGTYAVCLKENNKAIGSAGLLFGEDSNLVTNENEAELGYWIGVPFWGRGLIPEACREILRYGFEELGLNKIWCAYFDGNIKSKKVQEKLRFTYSHTNKNIYWELMDDYRTEHIYCMTKEQWSELQICNMALKEGFTNAVFMDVTALSFEPELREYCKENLCGNYDNNYACPPHCGSPEEMKEKVQKYKRALVLQTISPVTDIMNLEQTKNIQKSHNQKTLAFIDKMRKNNVDGLPAMAGPCALCERCGKAENEPCRFPDKLASCLSAYCINVQKMAEHCNIPYRCGENQIAFFSVYFI